MFSSSAPTQRLKTFLGGDTEAANAADAQPIADLVRLTSHAVLKKYCVLFGLHKNVPMMRDCCLLTLAR